MKPTKCPAKEKKMRQEIRNKRGEADRWIDRYFINNRFATKS